MKTWKYWNLFAIVAIIGIIVGFTACDQNGDGNGNNGGSLSTGTPSATVLAAANITADQFNAIAGGTGYRGYRNDTLWETLTLYWSDQTVDMYHQRKDAIANAGLGITRATLDANEWGGTAHEIFTYDSYSIYMINLHLYRQRYTGPQETFPQGYMYVAFVYQ
jgi:hypothetical protein